MQKWSNKCTNCEQYTQQFVSVPIPLYLESSKLFVWQKAVAQHTVGDSVASDPLVRILAALGPDLIHASQPRKCDLQPLVTIPDARDPGPSAAVAGPLIESSAVWAVPIVPHG